MTAGAGVPEWVARLALAGPPEAESLAALLGVTLTSAAENPDWRFYSFVLPNGPFAGGLLRLSTDGDGALVSLTPRDPPGLTEADVDDAAWGPRTGGWPNPRVAPEGADTQTYQLGAATLSTLWTHTSRRLLNLSLEWPEREEPPEPDEPPA